MAVQDVTVTNPLPQETLAKPPVQVGRGSFPLSLL